ncbi:hypothetical protein Mgra_00008299 [Meloidogyne graminicola]|uniref:Uncharacterized protein n=1 Tax=Meloidogyne graminicola TaxID=189291 RepID=A0A8S9ZG48_9BILA|nr:hypothetical protein Mgra_00008299 [Meloidogyne graminicola]
MLQIFDALIHISLTNIPFIINSLLQFALNKFLSRIHLVLKLSDKNSNQRANEASGMRYEAINDQTGKIDFFIREIPEELYYTNYKKPVVERQHLWKVLKKRRFYNQLVQNSYKIFIGKLMKIRKDILHKNQNQYEIEAIKL